MLRSRSVWFFTPSNPTITFGGMDGEPKEEMYKRLPSHLYPCTFYVNAGDRFATVLDRLQQSGISYPFVVKPDISGAGLLFRKIDHDRQLAEYHQTCGVRYVVQNLVQYPMEVSVFYYRMPNRQQGVISGFLHKVPMYVTGNGYDTLQQLIDAHPKSALFVQQLYKVHGQNLDRIIPAGQKYPLSHAANHNRGAQFINLHREIDGQLLAVFDDLSAKAGGWYYGRYDIMCRSVQDLKNGQHYSILEYNGCGAEPNHIYDSGYSLLGAYREILKHWEALYQISRYNRQQGIKPWPTWKGRCFLKNANRHLAYLRQKDNELSF